MTATMPNPPIDYTSKDYVSFRQDMLDAISTRMPEWTSRSPNDFGVILIELFAYVGDTLSFYGDRIANEAFLDTAVLRSSVLNIARMLDYRPTGNIAAKATLQFSTRVGGGSVTIPPGTQVSTAPQPGVDPIVFETDASLTIADTPPNNGTISATQGRTISNEGLGTSTGTIDQIFKLFNSPVIDSSQVIYVDEGIGAGPVAWQAVTNLIDSGPNDNVFTTFTDENNVVNIQFGDNVNGRVPPTGSVITAQYRIGGGIIGNIGSGTLTTLVNVITNVVSVTNVAQSDGGADAESLDDIRVNAPRSLTTLDRAVTLVDYANLSLKVAGIAKAKAAATVYTSITLYVAPYNGSATNNASTALKTTLQTYLSTRKMVNATITILDPTYVPINVTANVNVLPQFQQEATRLEVEKAVKSVVAFDNVDFGDRVTISEMYKAIMAVTGVDYAVVTVLSRTGTGLADVQMASAEIPSQGTITITATGGIVAG